MFKLKAILIVPVTLFAFCVAEAQTASDALPRLTDVAVPQDSPRAAKWWPKRHDEKIRLAKDAQVDLVFVGDSITHSWENAGAKVWREFYQDRNAFNLGFSGDRTEHVLWRIENGALERMKPALLVLMIGTNNTGYRMDPAAYTAEGIERIVVDIRERLPETHVLVLGIFPRHMSPYNEMRRRNDQINQLISALDDGEKIHYLNIGQAFLKDDGTLRTDLMPDLLHLNSAGYRAWAEAMEPTIRSLLRD